MLILAGESTYVPSIHFFLKCMYTHHWFLSFWICRSFTNFQGRRGALHSRLHHASERLASSRYLLKTSESTNKPTMREAQLSVCAETPVKQLKGNQFTHIHLNSALLKPMFALPLIPVRQLNWGKRAFEVPTGMVKPEYFNFNKKNSENVNIERMRLQKWNTLKINLNE